MIRESRDTPIDRNPRLAAHGSGHPLSRSVRSTSLADTLEQRGLIVRQPDPTDRRVRKLGLTADGRTMKATLEAEFAESLPGIGALAPAERDAFVDLLRKMFAAECSETTNGERA